MCLVEETVSQKAVFKALLGTVEEFLPAVLPQSPAPQINRVYLCKHTNPSTWGNGSTLGKSLPCKYKDLSLISLELQQAPVQDSTCL